MTSSSVLFEVADGIATLTLNEGERMNPLDAALLQGCLDALQRVDEDRSVRAMILNAHGRAFSVGADLADLKSHRARPGGESLGQYVGRLMAGHGNPMVAALRSLPVPVVCAVQGAVAGGGVGLALAADIVVAARSAYFYLPFVPALGLVPDMGSSWFLPRTVGHARALGLALLGDKLPAPRAAGWGLIWACVDDDQLRDEAGALAMRLGALPAHAIVETRALLEASRTNDLGQQMALERERQQVLVDRDAFAEGVRAFGDRRKPVFRGRGQGL
jgi:2-(1,2-epoxy-1,2-dihydrophenyl)acetyl-CoA isomerase